MPSYLTLEQAAERLAVSPRTIRRLVASGHVRAYRIGGRLLRIDPASLEASLRPIPTTGVR